MASREPREGPKRAPREPQEGPKRAPEVQARGREVGGTGRRPANPPTLGRACSYPLGSEAPPPNPLLPGVSSGDLQKTLKKTAFGIKNAILQSPLGGPPSDSGPTSGPKPRTLSFKAGFPSENRDFARVFHSRPFGNAQLSFFLCAKSQFRLGFSC